jgi:hypothetical protein
VSLALAIGTALASGLAVDPGAAVAQTAGLEPVVTALDDACAKAWRDAGVEPAGTAGDLLVARRIALALTGSTPSLEEIRWIEAQPADRRVTAYLDQLLESRRFSDYVAERLARAFVGVEEGPFLVFRRRRFVSWLSDALHDKTPYDAMVRAMVAGRGLWTDRPETNFITGHRRDPVELAARSTRAFLGLRLDCAQCHDHPFAHWKQRDFAGLSAFYAGIEQTITGIEDGEADFAPAASMMMAEGAASVAPSVPFAPEALPAAGTRRERLAAWITSSHNSAFAKAAVNRVWTLLLGESLTTSGVDDIEGDERIPTALAILGEDFARHGYDLRRLIRIVVRSRAFRLAADVPKPLATRQATDKAERFAAFPLVKLRPEQLAGSLAQLSHLGTLDDDSHLLWRIARATGIADFTRRYGDAGEDELRPESGTLMQQLTLMNGRITRERIEANLMSAAGRIAALAPGDGSAVRIAFLIALTREPTVREVEAFAATLDGQKGQARSRALEDLLWALVNSTEFSWSH